MQRRNQKIAAIDPQLLNQLTLRQVADIETLERHPQDISINAASIYLWKVSLPKDNRSRANSAILKRLRNHHAQHIGKRSGCRRAAYALKKSSSGKIFPHTIELIPRNAA